MSALRPTSHSVTSTLPALHEYTIGALPSSSTASTSNGASAGTPPSLESPPSVPLSGTVAAAAAACSTRSRSSAPLAASTWGWSSTTAVSNAVLGAMLLVWGLIGVGCGPGLCRL